LSLCSETQATIKESQRDFSTLEKEVKNLQERNFLNIKKISEH